MKCEGGPIVKMGVKVHFSSSFLRLASVISNFCIKFEASDLGDSVFYFLVGSVLTNDPPRGLLVL